MVQFWTPLPAVIAAGVLSALDFGVTGTQSIHRIPGDAQQAGYRVLNVEQQEPTVRHWIER